MKKNIIIISIFIILSLSSFNIVAQTVGFVDLTRKTQQSYLDRGYELVDFKSDSIIDVSPLVSSDINFDYKTYYIVLVQLDGCIHCDYNIQYVDERDYLSAIEAEYFIDNNCKQAIYKFTNEEAKQGKFVVLLNSKLAYYANIFVFKKKF